MLKTLANFLILFLAVSGNAFFPTNELPSSKILLQSGVFRMDLPFRLCRVSDNPGIASDKIASDNESAFIPLVNGKLKSVKVLNGTVEWESEFGGRIVQTPYLFGDYLVVISKTSDENPGSNNKSNDNTSNVSTIVRLIDKRSGLVRWKTIIEIESDKSISIFGFNDKLVIIGEVGEITALNLLDSFSGEVIGEKSLPKKLSAAPFFAADRIVLGTTDRQIIVISADTLEATKDISVAAVPTSVSFAGNNLFWADKKGRLTVIGTETRSNKQKWFLRTGGEIIGVTFFQENLLIASLDNYLYFVSADNGDILWKKRLANRPAFVPLLTRNYVLVLAVGDPVALIIDVESGATVNKINIGDENFFVGSPGKVFPFIFFPTINGIFFYTSETKADCPQRKSSL